MTDSRNLADNSKQTKNELLENRMLIFAANTVRELAKHKTLPYSIVDQLTRSAASIGANYAEACNASSKLDFRNKVFTSKKETAESRYWINLCIELTTLENWQPLRNEAQELLMILQAIINSLRAKV